MVFSHSGGAPLKTLFDPQPRQSQKKGHNKKGDMQKAHQAKLFPNHCPGEDKGAFHIENDKEAGNQVKGDSELHPGAATGNDTRSIANLLVAIGTLCTQPPGSGKKKSKQAYCCN